MPTWGKFKDYYADKKDSIALKRRKKRVGDRVTRLKNFFLSKIKGN